VPGTPFKITPDSSASERWRVRALVEMLTALSLPRPSSPWHPAHEELKTFLPCAEEV
jgi:hypothetical protein